MTPADLLAASPTHSISDTAIILSLRTRDGRPYRAAVHQLIREGKLRIIDPTAPITRWTVSTAELERYISEGPRMGDDHGAVAS